ncbi:hypothetical protein G6F57_001287 [Rhizopus arrhizus]|uniref:Uncharacterized protein n=1 Tax=Rhizopus oryzae TaxID=64495 RepID=A0A9P7BX33_RHIOR|nr:hypothetical protein G6F23_004143 [Rhizopus arrhizus]KAG0796386.1 hypothetical protein G6F21_001360 [Rhizopus arrhizus]KAG0798614.1 hypothetical protein G6F22_004049 [Rhizopus arrhizus]KAG0817834.1 hypothetical protein G6F20_002064 [Rhizopus arrhizus]KAG0843137.1 hypothetical protein G6F19_000669 [Rhizopus arrhizus]
MMKVGNEPVEMEVDSEYFSLGDITDFDNIPGPETSLKEKRNDPDDTAAVAVVVQRRKTIKHKAYPSGERGEHEEQELSEESVEERSKVYMTKSSALAFLKETMFIEKPYHQELYVQAFANSFYLRKILVKRFEEIKSTARQIERWVSSDGLWGKKTTRRIENVPVESRLLWVMDDENIGMKTISKIGMNARAKKVFSTFFVEFAEAISKNAMNYNTQKYRLRSSMAQQIADDEEENTQKRGLTTINNDEEYDEDGEEKEAEDDIWVKWKRFLDDPTNTQHLMQLSPEKHRIIWYGRLLRRRSCLPSDLYSKLNEEVSCIEAKYIHPCFFDGAMAVTSRDDMAVRIKDLSNVSVEDHSLVAERKLLTVILENFQREIYDNCHKGVLSKSEMCYRSYIFDTREIELEAMTVQLKNKGMTDGRYKYNADGLICANDFSSLEILLTEVSSGYGSGDSSKASFDHYKAMFGMLSMMRTIAETYNKGTFDTFRKLKIHFLHGHGNAIRHWSMSMQTLGVFLMNKEQRVVVPVDFKEKGITMIPFLQFYLTLAAGCEESLKVIKQLKEERKMAMANRNQDCRPSLLSFLNPSIIRLNEGKHMSIVAEEGPMSVPSSPDHH